MVEALGAVMLVMFIGLFLGFIGCMMYAMMCGLYPEYYMERLVNLFSPSSHKIVGKWIEVSYQDKLFFWECTCGVKDWGIDSGRGKNVHEKHRWEMRHEANRTAENKRGSYEGW